MKKKMSNRGFSLIELIIVIAIMAVLMVILTPQFLKYVEASRIQKDESLLGEVENAAKIACSAQEVYDALPSGDVHATITVHDGSQVTADVAQLQAEMQRTVPDIIRFASKKYREAGDQTVSISIDAPRQIVIVTNSWD